MKRLWAAVLRMFKKTPEVQRAAGQCCAGCRFFESVDDAEAEPDEPDGYCSQPQTGDYPYGGHWTHSASWCRLWSAKETKA